MFVKSNTHCLYLQVLLSCTNHYDTGDFMLKRVTTENEKLAWTLQEIADEMSVSVEFLRLEIKRGKLKTKKFGRCVRVLNADLQTYLSQSEQVPV
jgi:excisionase family DNA binding protein